MNMFHVAAFLQCRMKLAYFVKSVMAGDSTLLQKVLLAHLFLCILVDFVGLFGTFLFVGFCLLDSDGTVLRSSKYT